MLDSKMQRSDTGEVEAMTPRQHGDDSMNFAITNKQFHNSAPHTVKASGRTFKLGNAMTSDEDQSIRFDYTARKRRGAMFGDKLCFIVTLDPSDTYNMKVQFWNGDTFETREISQTDGVYCDGFDAVVLVAARNV